MLDIFGNFSFSHFIAFLSLNSTILHSTVSTPTEQPPVGLSPSRPVTPKGPVGFHPGRPVTPTEPVGMAPPNRCQPNPCQQGGTCIPIGTTDFSCQCPPAFTGKTCTEVGEKCVSIFE